MCSWQFCDSWFADHKCVLDRFCDDWLALLVCLCVTGCGMMTGFPCQCTFVTGFVTNRCFCYVFITGVVTSWWSCILSSQVLWRLEDFVVCLWRKCVCVNRHAHLNRELPVNIMFATVTIPDLPVPGVSRTVMPRWCLVFAWLGVSDSHKLVLVWSIATNFTDLILT